MQKEKKKETQRLKIFEITNKIIIKVKIITEFPEFVLLFVFFSQWIDNEYY